MIHQGILRVLLTSMLLAFVSLVCAKSADEMMAKGDRAYKRRSYDSAVSYYESAAELDNADAVAYYKLGNAHYRLKHIGEAVLNYEKALKRRPGFAAAAHNLEIAQQGIVSIPDREEVFFMRWWKSLTRPELSNTWAIISIIAFAIPLAGLAYRRYTKKRIGWTGPRLVIAGIVVGFITASLGLFSAFSDVKDHAAVVMKPDATIRLSPDSNGKSLIIGIPEGSIVSVLVSNGRNWKVTLDNGNTGDISSNYLSLVD